MNPSTYGLDATYSLDAELTGVGVYSQRILQGLARMHPDQRFAAYYRPHRYLKSWRAPHPPNLGRRILLDAGPSGLRLFHGLNQRLPQRKGSPSLVTFHDLFVMTGEYSSPDFRARFAAQARQAASHADLIVTVSRFTASQVEGLLGVPASRIRVIPHGCDPAPSLPGVLRESLILHVGAIQTRKNLVRLVEAFTRVAPPGWRLLLLGGDGYGSAAVHQAIASSSRRADIQAPGYATLAQLHEAYARASIFAFPSLDEGFGIPVLEAMAWGIPVLTSHRSALPEAAGGAALLVDPADDPAIADALHTLCTNEALRQRLIQAGFERVRRATWDQATTATWSVYREF